MRDLDTISQSLAVGAIERYQLLLEREQVWAIHNVRGDSVSIEQYVVAWTVQTGCVMQRPCALGKVTDVAQCFSFCFGDVRLHTIGYWHPLLQQCLHTDPAHATYRIWHQD